MSDQQRTEQWFADRAGKITASRIRDVKAFSEGGVYLSGPKKGQPKPVKPLKAREDYKCQLIAEILVGHQREQVKARSLAWGIDAEPFAIAAYEARQNVMVMQVGLITHPVHSFIGASPDFLVGTDGGGEVKCPENPEIHLATLINGLPEEHIEQIQGGLWCTDRAWWDFISFNPHFPKHLQLYVQRVYRDEAYIADMEVSCLQFWAEVQQILKRLQPNDTAKEAA